MNWQTRQPTNSFVQTPFNQPTNWWQTNQPTIKPIIKPSNQQTNSFVQTPFRQTTNRFPNHLNSSTLADMEIDTDHKANVDLISSQMLKMTVSEESMFIKIFSDLWKVNPNIIINAIRIETNNNFDTYRVKFNKKYESSFQQYVDKYKSKLAYKKESPVNNGWYYDSCYQLFINKK